MRKNFRFYKLYVMGFCSKSDQGFSMALLTENDLLIDIGRYAIQNNRTVADRLVTFLKFAKPNGQLIIDDICLLLVTDRYAVPPGDEFIRYASFTKLGRQRYLQTADRLINPELYKKKKVLPVQVEEVQKIDPVLDIATNSS